jgi:hypothetical protein
MFRDMFSSPNLRRKIIISAETEGDDRSPNRVVRTQYDGQRKVARNLTYHDHRLTIIDGHEKLRNINELFLVSVFHPYVRPKRPSLRPDLPSPTRSSKRRSRMGRRPPRQRRVASLRAVRCYAILGAGGVRVRMRFGSHFRFPSPLQLAGSGSGKRLK